MGFSIKMQAVSMIIVAFACRSSRHSTIQNLPTALTIIEDDLRNSQLLIQTLEQNLKAKKPK